MNNNIDSNLNIYRKNETHHTRNLRRNLRRNCIELCIPGLRNIIDIPFPDSKLPVCKPCKSLFKSREHCRLRDGHTDVAWNTSYVCAILDESCFTRKSQGLCLVDEDSVHFTAQSVSAPPTTLSAKNGNLGGIKAPFCMACKEKNYARYHCREMKKHQMLPWTTVYVLLSAVARIPESVPVCNRDGTLARNSYHGLNEHSKRSISGICPPCYSFVDNDQRTSMKKSKINECGNSVINVATSTAVETDDIRKIELSRAFLMTIGNDRSCELHWLTYCD